MTVPRIRAWAGATLIVAAAIVIDASPAWAHAVLLNSEPGPQTTSAVAPSTVRLQFSEPVEAAFGALHVLDVDGHDVTGSHLVRRSGGREFDIAVHPHPGTNFVTWQVVSSDGHVERGAYPFYVGAPSKGPAKPPPLPAGASAITGWLYGAFRFSWFAALFMVLGLVVARWWVWAPAALDLPAVDRSFRRALVGAGALGLVAGIGVLVGQGASDAGRSLLWAARASALKQVLQTRAGQYWLASLALAVAMTVPVAVVAWPGRRGREPQRWLAVLAVLAGAEALTTALGGHARTLAHARIGVTSLTVHLLAVGVWVGGLGAVGVLGGRAWRQLPEEQRGGYTRILVTRFSRVAVLAVGAVVTTGAVSAVLDLNSAHDLIGLPYGRVLLAKIVLLELALVLGARHLWFLPDDLGRHDAAGLPETSSAAARAFHRSALAELGVLGTVVGAATALMVMVPGRSAALAVGGQVDLRARAGSFTVELAVTPTQPGDDQLYLLFTDDQGRPARSVRRATAALRDTAAVPLVWLSDGRFTGTVTLPRAGRYRIDVAADAQQPVTSFTFSIAGSPITSKSQP